MSMRFLQIQFLIGLFLFPQMGFANPAPESSQQLKINKELGNLPLRFEKNVGQTSGDVKFISKGNGYSFFLTPTESVAVLTKVAGGKKHSMLEKNLIPFDEEQMLERSVIRMKMLGANPDPVIHGKELLPGTSNYFLGNDQKKWKRGVENFARVHYEEVYPGIDLVYYGNQKKLEYDFLVKPGADPERIQLHFKGAQKLSLDSNGNLVLETKSGTLIQKAPVVYQTIDGQNKPVAGHYTLQEDNRVAFHVPQYNHEYNLVIDPILEFSSYLGGTGSESSDAIAVNSAGDIYVTGSTNSSDFDILNEIEGDSNVSDVFIFKVKNTPTGYVLDYSTYLGGSNGEVGKGIEVNDSGNVWVTGGTSSIDFDILNEIEGDGGDRNTDIFVVKLEETPTGPNIVYSTYLGGDSVDTATDLAVDGAGNVYVTGYTLSTDFDTLNPIEGRTNDWDALVFKLEETPTGPALVYSTYLGGTSGDRGIGIDIDAAGNAYMLGWTDSTDFDIVNEIEGDNPQRDMFITKIEETPTGIQLGYSTYLGGSGTEFAEGIAVDDAGNAYITGWTISNDFNTVNPIEGPSGSWDVIVAKIVETPTGASLGYSTYLGGTGSDNAYGIALDDSGTVYITGLTTSADFDVVDPIEPPAGGADVFVSRIEETPTGPSLTFSTHIGGTAEERGTGIAVDPAGNMYVTGWTRSTDFDTVGEIEGDSGVEDILVFKIGLQDTTPPVLTVPSDVTAEATGVLTVVNIGTATATDDVSAPGNIIITNDAPAAGFTLGTTVVSWTAEDEAGNQSTDTQNVTVTDTTSPLITILGDNPIAAEFGEPYVDPWATAVDLVDGAVAISATSQPGATPEQFEVVYSATDSSGNTGTATRVIIFGDTTPPVITINGDNPLQQELGEPYIDPWATAVDNIDGPLLVSATSQAGAQPGTFEVIYSATDNSGNTATATRVITFADTIPPVITINGDNPINVPSGTPYVDPGATALDSFEGAIPVVLTFSEVSPGVFEVVYSATDSSGNTATATRTVIVIP